MTSLRNHFCFLLFYATNIILIPNSCYAKVCLPRQHNALFVFGDSLFDVGNNNYINTSTSYQANYAPYGENFFKYPSGRFSDGRVIPDFIAEYAKLPLIQPYLFPGNQEYTYGVNFASGGSGALVETQQGLAIDLKSQLGHFKRVIKVLRQKLEDAETESLLARAIYLIYIGPNDYFGSLIENSSIIGSNSPKNFVNMVIGNLTTVVKEIHNQGGRKFGFLTLGPLGCTPVVRLLVNGSGLCREEVTAIVKLHNSALSVELQKLEEQLKGFKYSLTNLYDMGIEVMSDPSKYGFREWGEACCGSGPYRGYPSCGGKSEVKDYELCENANEYFFFDYGHPTERANELIAQFIWDGNQTITGPHNLKSLFQL
ncbi:GDSL esterase/lipase 1-like [Prosopis cineraria]|uniref:GDSL esterase/lipase 1-like n=1 Tax=Prosopis cineraria TaxID=364024 RepID=UPI00240F72A6|nr:GDSL esterase/lipase 1-like [Prosopis cineraria]